MIPTIEGVDGNYRLVWPCSVAECAHRWATEPAFALGTGEALAGLPFVAVFFETPPVTLATANRPLEAMVLDAPSLARGPADPAPFSRYLDGPAPGTALTFTNLGGDAVLVVPRSVAGRGYPHLMAFLRTATADEQVALWAAVGEALKARLCERPVWVSTAGLGVAWLHIRLDDTPKYYRHGPYRG